MLLEVDAIHIGVDEFLGSSGLVALSCLRMSSLLGERLRIKRPTVPHTKPCEQQAEIDCNTIQCLCLLQIGAVHIGGKLKGILNDGPPWTRRQNAGRTATLRPIFARGKDVAGGTVVTNQDKSGTPMSESLCYFLSVNVGNSTRTTGNGCWYSEKARFTSTCSRAVHCSAVG